MRYLHITNRNFKDINPIESGEEYCSPTFRAGPTSRPYYLLHFIISGKGTFIAKGMRYNVTKGQIFVMHPFEVVQYHADPSDPWHYCWIGFELSLDFPVLSANSILDIPQAEHIFHEIKNSGLLGEQKELYICGKIFELMSMLDQIKTKKRSKDEEYVKSAKQYIDTNYMNPLTIEQISNMLNLNRSYLSTIFKKYIKKSPQQYLINLRLTTAAELMANHSYSVYEAAASSGYTDVFNFSKMFKQKFGSSPAVYAKRRKS